MNKEMREFTFEVRAEENEQHGTFITGTPIVFNQETDLGWYRESIDREALMETDLRDVRFLIGHNTNMIPLARSRNNNENSTMQMTVTDRGMEIRVDLDTENNADARALYSAVKRGDMSGMSFMFTVDKDSWEDIDTDNPKRTIMSIRKVFEVSAVAFPAYEGTDIQAASEGETLDSVKASLESARKAAEEKRAREAEQERRTALLERLEKLTKEVKDE
ncbi:MAG: HK97 family phage prohead protease [Clostridia bacterium]|nr:HK97 family phage prohead protease [Clostridia bacterium]